LDTPIVNVKELTAVHTGVNRVSARNRISREQDRTRSGDLPFAARTSVHESLSLTAAGLGRKTLSVERVDGAVRAQAASSSDFEDVPVCFAFRD